MTPVPTVWVSLSQEDWTRMDSLCVSNTYFNTKSHHRVSWRHRRSKHWHQLDLILTHRVILPSIKLIHSLHRADCDTDHYLVYNKVKIQVKRMYHTKTEGKPCFDTSKTCEEQKVVEFITTLKKSLPGPSDGNAWDRWEYFRDAVHSTAISTFGKKNKSADWFEAHAEIMTPAVEEKRKAMIVYETYWHSRLHAVMFNNAPDAVLTTVGWNSVLAFRLLLKQVTSRPCMMDLNRY